MKSLSPLETDAICLLLQYDLEKFAETLNLINGNVPELDESLAVRVLNAAEKLSHPPINDRSKQVCLLLCGLVWEHRRREWDGLPAFLVPVLGRIGLMPSTKMVDTFYDTETDKYGGLGSFIQELKFSRRVIDHEVKVGKNTLLLSDFQYNLWLACDQYSRLGVSAPTSAGKSFVLVNKIIELLEKNPGEVVYIVPTITLINQVTSDLRKAIKHFGFNDFSVAQTYSHLQKPDSTKNIYVLTQERALAALNQAPDSFEGIKLLVVDEVQNIERVSGEGDERSQDLYHTIQEFQHNIKPEKIIISGPRLKNITEFTQELFGEHSYTISDDVPPVLNITYSFVKRKKAFFLNQYSVFSKTPQTIKIENTSLVNDKTFNKVRFNPESYELIADVTSKLSNSDSGTIVFSPTKQKAKEIALNIAKNIAAKKTDSLESLAQYISESVHPKYSLVECIENGIGFHHGGVPHHVRLTLEKAFSKQTIKTIVCTTTLMQGVNLPAKNIIARSPYLCCEWGGAQLTPYEFSNLRGRAGRLMKDFVGRTILLDEGMFDESVVQLAELPQKEVDSGFGKRFTESQDEIIERVLYKDEISDDYNNNDIIVYMRQMTLRHGVNKAIERLNRVGITVLNKEIEEIDRRLQELEVPHDICMKNIHWDPYVLNRIYVACQQNEIPTVPNDIFSSEFVSTMVSVLNKISLLTPYYYKKYFPYNNPKYVIKILISAQAWAQEKKLSDVIGWRAECTNADIENMLDIINSTIPYSLPKLLRPVIQIQDLDNPILSFIEMGSYSEITRRLIELGLPRETAIQVSNHLNKYTYKHEERIPDEKLIAYIKNVYPMLKKWEQVQIEDFLV